MVACHARQELPPELLKKLLYEVGWVAGLFSAPGLMGRAGGGGGPIKAPQGVAWRSRPKFRGTLLTSSFKLRCRNPTTCSRNWPRWAAYRGTRPSQCARGVRRERACPAGVRSARPCSPCPQISEEDGVLTRTFLSPAHIRAAEQVQAGCGFRHPKREVLGRSGLPSRRGASWQCMRLLPGRMYGLPGCWHANVAPPPSAVSHGPVTASDRLCSRADTATGASPRDLSPNPRSSKTGWPALG